MEIHLKGDVGCLQPKKLLQIIFLCTMEISCVNKVPKHGNYCHYTQDVPLIMVTA